MRDGNALDDFLGEEVVDREGNPVGSFACFWEREEKNALLLGVDIPERSGHTHIVPARGARCNERQTYVQVSFMREKIIQAPCLECGREMDETFEDSIWAFYGLPMPGPVVSDLLAQKAETVRQQLRRIVRRDTPPAPCAPCSAEGSSCEAQESEPQKSSSEAPPRI